MRTPTVDLVSRATTEAIATRYANLPPLPDLPQVTSWLRQLNESAEHPLSGPIDVWLYCHSAGWPDATWTVGPGPARYADTGDVWPGPDHSEHVPGDTRRRKFDAVAVARRLLSEARSAGFK